MHRLPWTLQQLSSFIASTFVSGGGTWVTGIRGAVAEFCVGPSDAVDVKLTEESAKAITIRGAISFTLSEQIRAFAINLSSPVGVADFVVLAVQRSSKLSNPERGMHYVGLDIDAISDECKTGRLYDFGLGSLAGCFGVRTSDAELLSGLDGCLGMEWPAFLPTIGRMILRVSPTRVVRSPIGRIEVFTPVPSPSSSSPDGLHTHFLPQYLAQGQDLPTKMLIPDSYVPCAVHYPARSAAGMVLAPLTDRRQ